MMVSKALSEAAVQLELRSGELAGAIEELAALLAETAEVADLPPLVAELLQRARRQGASGNHEVAIVHAVTPAVERLCVALGRSPAGLISHGIWGPPVHFVCLLLVPPRQRRAGFRLLNGLAVLLRDPMLRTQLLWAETPKEALAICREAEESRWVALVGSVYERVVAALRPSRATSTTSSQKA